MVFRLGYLADIFWKTSGMSLSLQGKLSVANDKMKAFKQKLEFLKTCIATISLTSSEWTFLRRLVVILINMICMMIYMHLESLHNSVNQHFPND